MAVLRRLPLLGCLALVALALAPGARALPTDPPVTPIAPADGAVLETNPSGLAISYRCPRYGSYVDALTGIVVTKGSGDYEAGVSTSAVTGPDGRLVEPFRRASVVPLGADLEACETSFGSASSFDEPRPHRVPGTYYWQVWRSCLDCPGGYEVGPVWSFTVRLGVRLAVRAPRTAYAGIPVLVPVRVEGGTGDQVVLQRRQGAGWTTVATPLPGGQGRVRELEVAIIGRLPAGRQQLRAVVRHGDEVVASPVASVDVRKPVAWVPGATAVGRYRDATHPSLRFAIGEGARVLAGFTAQVPATCLDAAGNVTVASRLLAVPRVRIAPDGFFVLGGTVRGQRVWLQGRVTRASVKGYGSLQAGSCAGDLDFTARRAGP